MTTEEIKKCHMPRTDIRVYEVDRPKFAYSAVWLHSVQDVKGIQISDSHWVEITIRYEDYNVGIQLPIGITKEQLLAALRHGEISVEAVAGS